MRSAITGILDAERLVMVGSSSLGDLGPERHPVLADVLLVEDGDVHRLITRSVLEKARFRVETAQNGLEAVTALRGGRTFDIILMDLDMPIMDGFEATAAIRALGRTAGGDTPILALSAVDLDDPKGVALDGYLAKPYDPLRLVDEITRTLSRSGERAAAPDRPPVWDRRRYDDLVRRLGAAKVEKHLAALAERLRQVMSRLVSDPEDAKRLAWEAHALVSPAGVLGLEDLAVACQQVQIVGTATSCRTLSLALAAAIGRALMAIPHAEPRSE